MENDSRPSRGAERTEERSIVKKSATGRRTLFDKCRGIPGWWTVLRSVTILMSRAVQSSIHGQTLVITIKIQWHVRLVRTGGKCPRRNYCATSIRARDRQKFRLSLRERSAPETETKRFRDTRFSAEKTNKQTSRTAPVIPFIRRISEINHGRLKNNFFSHWYTNWYTSRMR